MTPYATLDDLYAAFPRVEIDRLLDKNGTGNPDDATLAMAQDYATATINATVGNRVQQLLDDPEKLAMLKFPAVDLMRWRLYGSKTTEEVQARFDAAMTTLKNIRAGLLDIGQTAGTDATAAAESTIQILKAPTRWGDGYF
jgi:phage gp36-like protein